MTKEEYIEKIHEKVVAQGYTGITYRELYSLCDNEAYSIFDAETDGELEKKIGEFYSLLYNEIQVIKK